MKWLFNRCRRYEAGLSLLAAGALPDDGRADVEMHVVSCPACRMKLAELQMLARGLAEAGRRLPEDEAPVSLRRRWMTAVRESASEQEDVLKLFTPAWLSRRRLACGTLAVMWALVLFFRFSVPDAPKPAALASAPSVSLRELIVALKVEASLAPSRADKRKPTLPRQSLPDGLPPRSQVSPVADRDWEVA